MCVCVFGVALSRHSFRSGEREVESPCLYIRQSASLSSSVVFMAKGRSISYSRVLSLVVSFNLQSRGVNH